MNQCLLKKRCVSRTVNVLANFPLKIFKDIIPPNVTGILCVFFLTYNKIVNKPSRSSHMHPLALTVNANSTALLLAQEIQLSWDDKLIIQQDRSDKETGAPTSLFRRDRADWQD
jgi:hypothetical protein